MNRWGVTQKSLFLPQNTLEMLLGNLELWAQFSPWCLWWTKEQSSVSLGVIRKKDVNREGREITKEKVKEKRIVRGTLWLARSGPCLPFLLQQLTIHLILWIFEPCVLSISDVFLSSPVFHLWKPTHLSRLSLTCGPSTFRWIIPSQFLQELYKIDIISIHFFSDKEIEAQRDNVIAQRHSASGAWSPPATALSILYCA